MYTSIFSFQLAIEDRFHPIDILELQNIWAL